LKKAKTQLTVELVRVGTASTIEENDIVEHACSFFVELLDVSLEAAFPSSISESPIDTYTSSSRLAFTDAVHDVRS
jgi:hypothetical protein